VEPLAVADLTPIMELNVVEPCTGATARAFIEIFKQSYPTLGSQILADESKKLAHHCMSLIRSLK
jgi:hypothetical protein